MSYNYKDSKANIINIIKTGIPIEKKQTIPANKKFTYNNGIRCPVSAIFVDIVNSSLLFKDKDLRVANIIRSLTSELIKMFQHLPNRNQVGIRGDCVYAICSTPNLKHVNKIFKIAVKVNTFMDMFNKLLAQYNYPQINIGIGLGCDDDELIIKAGRSGTGTNDKIWIGKAVVDASKLSSIANRRNHANIAMNSLFYKKIKQTNVCENNLIEPSNDYDYFDSNFYECDLVQDDFFDWIQKEV